MAEFLLASKALQILNAVRGSHDCAVVEVDYLVECRRQFLTRTVEQTRPGTIIKYICFENNVTIANANCVQRARWEPWRDPKANCRQNERMSRDYTYPPGAEIRRMHPL